jgi:membrane protease YdiL (CAAX protease family)
MVRERKTIYLELLVTVGLLVIPSLLKAVYAFLHPGESSNFAGSASWGFASLAVFEILLLLLVWHILRLNGETFGVLTEPFQGKDVLRGIGLSIWCTVSYYGFAILLMKLAGGISDAEKSRRSLDIFYSQFSVFYLLGVIVNPFGEEVLVRGFLQTRLRQAGHGALVAVAVSTVLQTSYHLYQGLIPCLALLPGFLVFAAYYQAHRRLWPVLISHLILDLWAMLAHMKTG